MSTQSQIAQTQSEMGRFAQTWNAKIQPLLERNPRVPAQFILDVFQTIAKNVANPIFETQDRLALSASMANTGLKFLGFAVGGAGVTVQQSVVDVVSQLTEAAAQDINFQMAQRLSPLAAEAQAAIAKQGKTATVQIVTSGSDRIDQVILETFTSAIDAWQRIAQVQDLAASSYVFKLSDLGVGAALTIGRALAELGRVLASGLTAIYDSVVGIARLIKMVVLAGIVGGAGYVAYQFFKPTQATQNPYRRRRSRRARPRLYLR